MKTIILHKDKDILICHKPTGLAVENVTVGRMDIVSELKNHIKSSYLGVVHRLDQPVEGLLVFAKNQKAAASLSRQLQQNTLNKEYYAVACGKLNSETGRLVEYLAKDNKTRMAKVINKTDADAREAILDYRVIQTKKCSDVITGSGAMGGLSETMLNALEISLLNIQIQTGRFHQIRVQLSNAGMPILGDQKYGNEESVEMSLATGTKNVALCACSLHFKHPATGKRLSYEIKPDSGAFSLFEIK